MVRWILLVTALAACTPEGVVPPVGQQVDPVADPRAAVSPAVGSAPLTVAVRAVDDLGTPWGAGSVTVEVGGEAVEVAVDGHGYGEIVVEEPGTTRVGDAPAHATGAPWSPFALQRVVPLEGEASQVVPAAGGALVARPDAVWWVGADGSSFVVLVPPEGETVGGVRAAHLDLDGVIDGLAWAGSRLVLLRGRAGGGVSRGAALEAGGRAVVAAAAGDTDGDAMPDVAVLWEGSILEVWEQRGPWDFAAASPLDLAWTPFDVAVGDSDGEGAAEITVTNDSGQWLRYRRSRSGRYGETGPRGVGFDMGLPEGTAVRSGFDFNGDGGDEILLMWPPEDGGSSTLQVWDLVVEEFPRVFPVVAADPRVSVADAEGDGLSDLWTLDAEATLRTLSRRDGDNVQRTVATLPVHAPFTAVDRLGDETPDLLLAGPDAATWWRGGTVELEDGRWWAPSPPSPPAQSVDLRGPLAVLEVDGDPATLEVVGFRTEDRTLLVAYRMDRGDPASLEELDIAVVSQGGGAPLDLAVCGGHAYALADDALSRIDPGGGGIFRAATRAVTADRVACAGDRVALLSGDAVQIRDQDLVMLSTEDHPGAVDVALVDGPEVVTCATPGCTVVPWRWGAAGEVSVAIGDDDGVVVTDAAGETGLPGAGEVAVVDVEGDGLQDLLVRDGDRVLLYRSSGEGFGVPEGFHAPLLGLPVVADAVGDGGGDLLYLEPGGRLVFAGP